MSNRRKFSPEFRAEAAWESLYFGLPHEQRPVIQMKKEHVVEGSCAEKILHVSKSFPRILGKSAASNRPQGVP